MPISAVGVFALLAPFPESSARVREEPAGPGIDAESEALRPHDRGADLVVGQKNVKS
jgi:hypothetical protein